MSFVINRLRSDLWKADTLASVEQYNNWFFDAAPDAYQTARAIVQKQVLDLMEATNFMRDITPEVIFEKPELLETLRQGTAPPIARDRLSGLSGVARHLVKRLEEGHLPQRTKRDVLERDIQALCDVIERLLDHDLFDWLATSEDPTEKQKLLASVVVSDRKTGAIADPVIRNAQERRQLSVIRAWLLERGYKEKPHDNLKPFTDMTPGTFSFRQIFPALKENGTSVGMPIDAVIQPHNLYDSGLPLLVEAKSAGDFTNTNKRRKEEATKLTQIRRAENEANFILFLCGYFDASYLGYEAAEGIDWVWEHRLKDFELAGL